MKILTLLLFTFVGLSNGANSASYSEDTDVVTQVYANPAGSIALRLKDGFSAANKAQQCPGNNGFAGLSGDDVAPIIKSIILAAKVSGQPLTVITEGCNGSWLKILSVHLK